MTLPTYDGYGHDALPTLSAFRRIVARVRGNVDRLLPASNQFSTEDVPKPVRQLAASWRVNVAPRLDEIEPVLQTLAERVAAVINDQTRTGEYRTTASTVAVSSATAAVKKLGAQIETAVDGLLTKAQRLAMPARPTPQDAAQEARLGGIKSDLGLVVSTADTTRDFVTRLQSRLVTAISDGDALSIWLLSSDWPTAVLASSMRGFDSSDLKIIDAEWSAALTDALALGDEDTRAAISTYRALADTQNGLPALKVACGGFLVGIVADEADYISRQAA